jgi:cell division protein ZapA
LAQVEVSINGRNYSISCDDGQEAHLVELGEYVDRRVKGLVTDVGQVGDSRLLVMASLLIADELAETYADMKNKNTGRDSAAGLDQLEERVAGIVDAAAEQIEQATAGLSGDTSAAE